MSDRCEGKCMCGRRCTRGWHGEEPCSCQWNQANPKPCTAETRDAISSPRKATEYEELRDQTIAKAMRDPSETTARLHVLDAVLCEVCRACVLHPRPPISAHESYAVIREELDEYWDSVKRDEPDAAELVQVAATAIRAILAMRTVSE